MRKLLLELQPEEEVVGLVRAHPLSQVGVVLFGFTWFVAPFFFLFPLLGLGLFGVAFFLIFLASGVWNAVKRFRMWNRSILLITDLRVIDVHQEGVFKREFVEVAYDDIKDVSVKQKGIVQRLFGLGTVRVRTTKTHSFDLQIVGVRNPGDVADLILDVQYMTANQSEGETFHVAKKKIG